MAAPLIAVVVLFGGRNVPDTAAMQHDIPLRRRWGEAGVTLGLIVIIFGGFRSGFAVATETSAFAALYASSAAAWCSASSRLRHGPGIYARRQAIGPGIVHRRGGAGHGVRADVQQIPHALGNLMVGLSLGGGTWLFMLRSIAILIVMESVLEGAAALIIFGPLMVPAAVQLGVGALHYGAVLVIAMGIGLFAPPLGLGLYGACLIGNVPIEVTVKLMVGYLGLLLLCVVAIVFVPGMTIWLPKALGC